MKISIENDEEFSQLEKENHEANYRKLWLKLKVDAPFMVHLTKIQQDFDLPITVNSKDPWEDYTNYLDSLRQQDKAYFKSEEFKQIAPIINSIFILNLPDKVKREIFRNLLYNLPSIKFKKAVKELLKKFEFEDFWLQTLAVNLVTDKILPPYEQRSKDCPPEHVTEDWMIFMLSVQKKAQHDFLKSQGYKQKDIAKIYKLKISDKLPDKIIHSNLNIAQKVWGDWEDLCKDKSKSDLVKQRNKRFSKFFVNLSDEDMKVLESLNLPRKNDLTR